MEALGVLSKVLSPLPRTVYRTECEDDGEAEILLVLSLVAVTSVVWSPVRGTWLCIVSSVFNDSVT